LGPEAAPHGAPAIRDEEAVRAAIATPNPGDFCYGSNGYRWKVEYTASQLAAVLAPVIGRLEHPESRVIRVAVVQRTLRGCAVRVRVTTTEGEYEIAGEYAIRSALGGTVTIKSGVFVVDTEGDPPSLFVFSGAGYGHGVGMCQYGARGMARAGYSYRAILGHYYPGTTVEPILRSAGN
jgi:SpoIID/LytB domain protein